MGDGSGKVAPAQPDLPSATGNGGGQMLCKREQRRSKRQVNPDLLRLTWIMLVQQ